MGSGANKLRCDLRAAQNQKELADPVQFLLKQRSFQVRRASARSRAARPGWIRVKELPWKRAKQIPTIKSSATPGRRAEHCQSPSATSPKPARWSDPHRQTVANPDAALQTPGRGSGTHLKSQSQWEPEEAYKNPHEPANSCTNITQPYKTL